MRKALSLLVLLLSVSGIGLSLCDTPVSTFEMVAYTGVPVKLGGSKLPMVVDIQGIDLSNKSRPILKDHTTSKILGHTTEIVNEGGVLKAKGVLSGYGELQDVIDSGERGFPWQASIGFIVLESEEVKDGETVNVNGRTFNGPLTVVRKSKLLEISVVVLGADDATSTRVEDHRIW